MTVDRIGTRFRVTGPLGKGNMGEVHRAVDLQAGDGDRDREVAVKVILRSRTGAVIDSQADVKAVQRFEREIRIMRSLNEHRNLPRIIAGGLDEGTACRSSPWSCSRATRSRC